MNQPPGQPPGYGPPGYPPQQGYYGAPQGGGSPPQGPYRAPDGPPPPKDPGRWVTSLLVLAIPGNVGWLIAVGFGLSTQIFRQNPVACVLSAAVPHLLFTSLFATLIAKPRPEWSPSKRFVAGSFITSGLAGWIGFILLVLTVGLVAAACGGCGRR